MSEEVSNEESVERARQLGRELACALDEFPNLRIGDLVSMEAVLTPDGWVIGTVGIEHWGEDDVEGALRSARRTRPNPPRPR